MKSKAFIYGFLISTVMVATIISGCLTPAQDENYTVQYNGVVYPIGDTNTVTADTLESNTFYPFVNIYDEYYFVNGKGQIYTVGYVDDKNKTIYVLRSVAMYGEDMQNWTKFFAYKENETYTVQYRGITYPVGNTQNLTKETLEENVFYPFFENGVDKTDGYVYINKNGEVFIINENNNYIAYSIVIKPYQDDYFDWDEWFLRMG